MTELGAFLLPAVPLLVLLAFLLAGRYPGAEAIVRLGDRIAPRRRPRAVARARRPRPLRTVAPAGGLLIALARAERGPPLAA